MQEGFGRLRQLEASAADAFRVIRYFDSLVANRAGLDSLLRAGAVLTESVVGFADLDRRLELRVSPEGRVAEDPSVDEDWPSVNLGNDASARVWIERTDAPGALDDIVLERMAAGVKIALDRTRHSETRDPASVDVLLDPASSEMDRDVAARRLLLDGEKRLQVVAAIDTERPAGAVITGNFASRATQIGRVTALILVRGEDDIPAELAPLRQGIGPTGDVLGLPESWRKALFALRLTGDATPDSPGPRLVRYDDVGVLADVVGETWARASTLPDVARLIELERLAPRSIEYLEAIVATDSLRQAADRVHVHHSTLQARQNQLQKSLGYALGAAGKARLNMALLLVRAVRNGSLP
ncbi:MAG: hypothetical protein J0I50_02985 [Microbacterium sp.]|uniref:hypothetical protein n=1 Tax=Microbacterium sp. TaxID=51671 RepID=UPI001AC08520|nr:hypothetical protein [Microbacterium sp.]MBN9155779.1 hypothetical protein [Microbacterium sp.]MBN9170843.1 hypothetical protein [Microbacterium sp.]